MREVNVLILCLSVAFHLLISVLAAGDKHHPVPTYFWRRHENGTLVDRSSPNFYAEIKDIPVVTNILTNDATNVKLQAWPDSVKNGEKLTVLWSHHTNRQSKDFIAFYCPYYDNLNHYLDWFYISSIPGYEKGYGHAEHHVYNMRAPCVYRLFRQVWKTKTTYYYSLAATSNLVKFADGGPYAPTQGHISLTNNPTEMRVMWVSAEVLQPPMVRYGLTKDMPMKEYAHLTHTYTADSMCQRVAVGAGFWHPGTTYDFLLKNLKPNTLYYYAYGTEEGFGA